MKKQSKQLLFGLLLIGVIAYSAYYFNTSLSATSNSGVIFYNEGTGTMTCWFRNGDSTVVQDSFTVNAGSSRSFTIGTQGYSDIFDSKCYCAESYQTNFVDTDFTRMNEKVTRRVNLPCTGAPTTTTLVSGYSCTDSDNGKNYNQQGTVKTYYNGVQEFLGNDNCLGDDKTLSEYYCLNNEAKATTYVCPNSCQGGQCVGTNPDTCEKHGLSSTGAGYYCTESWINGVGWCYSCQTTTSKTSTTTYSTTTTNQPCFTAWSYQNKACIQSQFCEFNSGTTTYATKEVCEAVNGIGNNIMPLAILGVLIVGLLIFYLKRK
jgi:hypothetical protein